MKQFEFFSNVDEDGNLQGNVMMLITKCLLNFVGKRIQIIIKIGSQRSNKQNAYYWGCVVVEQAACFLERWGEIWDKDEVHDWNKNNIWFKEIINEDTGECIRKPGSSKTQSKSEFEERMEKLRQKFELEFDWRISLPNEQSEMDFK